MKAWQLFMIGFWVYASHDVPPSLRRGISIAMLIVATITAVAEPIMYVKITQFLEGTKGTK